MSSPIYTPGNEPDELYEKICVFLDDIDKVFPENRVYLDQWNHERWDRPIEYLCRSLGYEKGRDFLYAYGYGVPISIPQTLMKLLRSGMPRQ